MMQILYILKYTPFYVYLLFIYLMFIGIRATKPRIINSPKKLFLMPLIFLLFFLKGISNIQDFSLLILTIITSFFVNLKLLKPSTMQTKDNVLIITGSYQPLLMIICIFLVKYFLGYMKAATPELSHKYRIIDSAMSGTILGVTFSKAYFYYQCFINKVKKID